MAQVQCIANSTASATSLAFSPSSTTAGNGLVAVMWLGVDASLDTGNLPANWTSRLNTGQLAIVDYMNNSGGITSVTFNFTSATAVVCFLMERDDIDLYDTSAHLDNGTVTSWTSGNTGTTAYTDEIAIGFAGSFTGNPLNYVAGASWTAVTGTNITAGEHAGAGGNAGFCETRTLSGTGAYAATGTVDSSYQYALIATYRVKSLAGTSIAWVTA